MIIPLSERSASHPAQPLNAALAKPIGSVLTDSEPFRILIPTSQEGRILPERDSGFNGNRPI
jgi:hypothetical protein